MANQFGPPPHNPPPGFGPAGPHGYGAPAPEPYGWAAAPPPSAGQTPYYGPPAYPPPPPPPRKRKGPLAFIAAGLFVVLVACNALTDDNRMERSQGAAPRPAPTVEEENTVPAESLATDQAKPTKAARTRRAAAAEKFPLPNVVGMNLQFAQDTMQAAGFFLLRDRDATGRGRFQVNDRNWVVVRQVPAAGRKVDPATFVTLWAKKIGE